MLVATIVVVVTGSLVFAGRSRRPDFTVTGKVSGTPTPTAERPDAARTSPPAAGFVGTGSWAMSSLPSCFRESESVRGSVAALGSQFPPAAERVRPSSVLTAGDCRVVVREHELWISRGADRLLVPPEARLYRDAGRLTLVYTHGTRAEIRRY